MDSIGHGILALNSFDGSHGRNYILYRDPSLDYIVVDLRAEFRLDYHRKLNYVQRFEAEAVEPRGVRRIRVDLKVVNQDLFYVHTFFW